MKSTADGFVARSFFLTAVSMALMVLAGPAFAQKAERPAVKVGDRWVFEEHSGARVVQRAWVVTSVMRNLIGGTENGHAIVLTRDLNPVATPADRHSNEVLLKFPLEVGKRWSFSDDYVVHDTSFGDLKGYANFDVVVAAYEKVRVPAGEFEAFRLELKGKWLSPQTPGPGETAWTCWYAPAARAIVKEDRRASYMPHLSEVLLSFQLQP